MENTNNTTQLQQFIEEYYNSSHLSESRRKEIELCLSTQFGGPQRIPKAVGLINQKQNLLQWFGFHLIEACITDNTWSALPEQERDSVTSMIINFLATQHKVVPKMSWVKACKALVAIMKVEENSAKFDKLFDTIIQISSKGDSVIVGLTLLRIVSEEFWSSKEDLPLLRKQQLQNMLLKKVTVIFGFLDQILNTLHSFYQKTTSLFKSNVNNAREIAVQVLETLNHYLTWAPLEKYVSIIPTLFKYCSVNEDEVVTHAVGSLNEIVSKAYIPKNADNILVQIFSFINTLVGNITSKYQTNLNDMDPELLDRIMFLILTFVQLHLSRILNLSTANVVQFFEQFHKLTFMHTEGFVQCLEIWMTFLNFFEAEKENRASSNFISLSSNFKSTLLLFASGVMNKMQFQSNAKYLQELSSSDLDALVHTSVECIGIIADLYPEELTPAIKTNFNQLLQSFARIPITTIEKAVSGKVISICRDVILFLRIHSRINDLLASDLSKQYMEVYTYFGQCVGLYNTSIMLFEKNKDAKIVVMLLEETLSSMQMFTQKLRNFEQAAIASKEEILPKFSQVVTSMLDVCVKSLNPSLMLPEEVSIQASKLFYSICLSVTAAPSILLGSQSFQVLSSNLMNITSELISRTKDGKYVVDLLSKIYSGYCQVILNTYRSNELELKSKFNGFMQIILVPFNNTIKSPTFEASKPTSISTLYVLLSLVNSIVQSLSGSNKMSKITLKESISPILGSFLDLLKLYSHNAVMLNALLDLFHNLFRSLSNQLGFEYISETAKTFLDQFVNIKAQELLIDKTGKQVLNKLLEILTILVLEGSGKFTPLLPDILVLSKDKFFPLIKELAPEVALAELGKSFYTLMYSILFNWWSLFFTNDFTNNDNFNTQRAAYFTFILETFIFSFRKSDINIFKQNLDFLENLNQTRKLYHREVFIKDFMAPLLRVLMDDLVSKSLNLLREDIIKTVYHMVSNNLSQFRQQFIPAWLHDRKTLTGEQVNQLVTAMGQSTTSTAFASPAATTEDVAAFTKQLNHFVNDCAYYESVNKKKGF